MHGMGHWQNGAVSKIGELGLNRELGKSALQHIIGQLGFLKANYNLNIILLHIKTFSINKHVTTK